MWKGKGNGGRLVRSAVTAALVLVFSGGRCRALDSWQRGMGGVIFPSRGHPAAPRTEDGYLFAEVSATNLFSIPGLYQSAAALFFVTRCCSAAVSWECVSTAGFRRDRVEARAGPAIYGGIIEAGAILEIDCVDVTGCGSDSSVSAGIYLSSSLPWELSLEAAALRRRSVVPVHVAIMAGGDGTYLAITIGRDSRGVLSRAGGSLRLARMLSLIAGYDIGTGEVSGGVSLKAALPAAFSWSIHPVLGSTFSVTVGVVR